MIRPSAEGTLRVGQDVVLERFDGRQIIAITEEPAIVESVMTLEIHRDEGDEPIVRQVRVAGSQPIVDGGSVRHRVLLQSLPEPGETISEGAETS